MSPAVRACGRSRSGSRWRGSTTRRWSCWRSSCTGSGKASTAIRGRAQQAIREDLGPDAPILTTVISHLESVAKSIRDFGQLAFELERDLAEAAPWYEQLRAGVPAQPGPARTSGNLAEDFRSLAQELFARLAEAEHAGARA